MKTFDDHWQLDGPVWLLTVSDTAQLLIVDGRAPARDLAYCWLLTVSDTLACRRAYMDLVLTYEAFNNMYFHGPRWVHTKQDFFACGFRLESESYQDLLFLTCFGSYLDQMMQKSFILLRNWGIWIRSVGNLCRFGKAWLWRTCCITRALLLPLAAVIKVAR